MREFKSKIKSLYQNNELIAQINDWKAKNTEYDEKGKAFIDSEKLKRFILQLQCQRKWI